jgi:gamma-glutamylaminecyclotransferase
MKVFVYGTLKSKYWNNRLLAGATFLGEAFTEKRYTMRGSGVPYIMPNDAGFPVKGEVFEIDEQQHLPGLDRLEGHPTGYTRTTIDVKLVANGDVVPADIYEMLHERGSVHDTPPSKGYWEWNY